MTIAACYLSPEGVVLGADSTSSAIITPGPGLSGFHYFNHAQKLFELGEDGTVGVLTWGLGTLTTQSYRTLLALLSDDLEANPPTDVAEVANRWASQFWATYSTALAPLIQRCAQLHGQTSRAPDEEQEYLNLRRNLVVGFCIAGYWLPSREATAFQIIFDPLQGQPTPLQIPHRFYNFWGAPNIVQRLIFGRDENLKSAILQSGHWGGTEPELDQVLDSQVLAHPILPIRDAVDFVHTCIYSTIKALKFSHLFQVCGGPIEIAIITSDRRFRWVRHKGMDSAIDEA